MNCISALEKRNPAKSCWKSRSISNPTHSKCKIGSQRTAFSFCWSRRKKYMFIEPGTRCSTIGLVHEKIRVRIHGSPAHSLYILSTSDWDWASGWALQKKRLRAKLFVSLRRTNLFFDRTIELCRNLLLQGRSTSALLCSFVSNTFVRRATLTGIHPWSRP